MTAAGRAGPPPAFLPTSRGLPGEPRGAGLPARRKGSDCARRVPLPPAPSPRKLREERGRIRSRFGRIRAGRGRPLRASTTRPPPPKLLGEVGVGLGSRSIERDRTAPAEALPRLLPLATARGEGRIRSRATGPPRGSPVPAPRHPPIREGGFRVVVAANSFAPASTPSPAAPRKRVWWPGLRRGATAQSPWWGCCGAFPAGRRCCRGRRRARRGRRR